MNKKKIAKIVYYVVCSAITLWLVLSFAEVMAHNIEPGSTYVYNRFNAFQMLVDACKARRGV